MARRYGAETAAPIGVTGWSAPNAAAGRSNGGKGNQAAEVHGGMTPPALGYPIAPASAAPSSVALPADLLPLA
jgi:hypothetical protein